MDQATRAVKDGKMNVLEAARTFNVPKSTLRGRLRGSSVKKGRPRTFTETEQAILEDVLLKCAAVGLPLNKRWLINIVADVAERKGTLQRIVVRLIDRSDDLGCLLTSCK